jgi:hypothetical protein
MDVVIVFIVIIVVVMVLVRELASRLSGSIVMRNLAMPDKAGELAARITGLQLALTISSILCWRLRRTFREGVRAPLSESSSPDAMGV